MPRIVARNYGGGLLTTDAGTGTAKTSTNAALSPGSGDFTIAFWSCYGDGIDPNTRPLCMLYSTTWQDGVMIFTSAAQQLSARVCYANGGNVLVASPEIAHATHDWRRVVLTGVASSKTSTIYVDGVQVASSAAAWTGNFGASCIFGVGTPSGEYPSTRNRYADAVLDIGHAWNATQVAADYYRGLVPSTATHRWLLADGSGTTGAALLGGLALTTSGGASFVGDSPMKSRAAAGARTMAGARTTLATSRTVVP